MVRIDIKTRASLEFPNVLHTVAEFCLSEAGKQRVQNLEPFKNLEEIQPELHRVFECKASLMGDNMMPNHSFDSIDEALHLLTIENSCLTIAMFQKIASLSETTKTLLVFFKKNKEFYKYLFNVAEIIHYEPLIASEIRSKINRFGEVIDHASETLYSIRKKLKTIKNQINASFNRALNQYAQQEYLDEIRESIVDNRRVLAIKAMHRKKIKGAVLGTSKTGSIVYIEPQETLEFTNQLSNLQYEEVEEIKVILKSLTQFVKPYLNHLISYQNYLINIDIWTAKARYAQLINGVFPRISNEKKLFLKDAYHPILLLSNKEKKEKTYPQTINLNPENRIIVISGPNAGGKSITLKTVGLLQLMLQCGILIPVDKKSEFSFFKRILSDIGDNQSIENQLSTYSFRLKKMNQFLKKCKEDTLFLIDEFGTGSDPELGGALAETFLEVFYERQSFGIITTHYTNLKLLANELPYATNANMQFNTKTLEPMYQLQLGEAGSSFTFEVAQKNGIPYGLINKAKKKIERGKIRFDKSIVNLQKERADLRNINQSLKSKEQKVNKETKQLEVINTRLQSKLESYQELYDANQRLLNLGKKIDTLAKQYTHNKNKKKLLNELYKMVLVENSKLKKEPPKSKKEKKEIKAKKHEIKQEIEQKVAVIRKRKKKEKAKKSIKTILKPKVPLKINDRVRMLEGVAIGTIDKIEKNKAFVNYGTFTTNVSLSELEKV